MKRHRIITQIPGASAIVLWAAASLQAGANRTFVSTAGNDSNTTANCSNQLPCRTFMAALTVTNPGGEIVVLNSGGYGPATITQPVILSAIGVDASVSANSGGNGLTIDTPGNVTLIGLNLHGEGIGANGVKVNQVGILRLYNMLIENFADNGVDFEVSGKLEIYGSSINDNQGGAGLFVNSASASSYVQSSAFNNNGSGVSIEYGQMTVADSSAEYNLIGFLNFGGTLTLFDDRALFNQQGLVMIAEGVAGGTLYFVNCLIANNTWAYNFGGVAAGTTPGTSFVAPGQNLVGPLSTPITLQ